LPRSANETVVGETSAAQAMSRIVMYLLKIKRFMIDIFVMQGGFTGLTGWSGGRISALFKWFFRGVSR
jgi:hypothetical protein